MLNNKKSAAMLRINRNERDADGGLVCFVRDYVAFKT